MKDIPAQTKIMGILNLTPDSFSDGNLYYSLERSLIRTKEMEEEGADIIDIGGESTRPDSVTISVEEEKERVILFLKEIVMKTSLPISIDTYKADVARAALDAGAKIINDVWGMQKDIKMAKLAAEYECKIVLTHNRETPRYNDFLSEVIGDMGEIVNNACKSGIKEENIILDPGIGFGKTFEQNLYLLKNLSKITEMGYPVLLGVSRKSVIRNVLKLPTNQLIDGTSAVNAIGIFQGCRIIRVHDVKEAKRLGLMCDSINNAKM